MKKIIPILCIILVCSSCAPKMYKRVMTEDDNKSYNSRILNGSYEDIYNTIIETFLTKKFMIENENMKTGNITGLRHFNKGKRNIIIALQAKLIKKSNNSTAIYLNAIETAERNYVADRTRFFLFLIPLPGGGGKEASKMTESEKFIDDPEFYTKIFLALQDHLPEPMEELVKTEIIPKDEPNVVEPKTPPPTKLKTTEPKGKETETTDMNKSKNTTSNSDIEDSEKKIDKKIESNIL